MAILKSLSFTAVSKNRNSPTLQRRTKLVNMLKEQRALFTDPNYARVVQRWRLQDGQKVKTDHQIKVRPWWFEDEKGQTVFSIKFGLKTLEFEKGKSGILVGPKDRLVKTIETLIEATSAGEFDSLLEPSKDIKQLGKRVA